MMVRSQFTDRLYARYATTIFANSKPITKQQFEDYARYYRRTLSPYLPDNKDVHILDIGCGLGHLLYFLKEQGYRNLFGVDIGREQIEICRQLVTENVENIENISAYLEKQPDKYEAIFLFDVLEHIDDDELFPLLDAVRNAMSPGSKFLISVPNAACFPAILTRYADMTHKRLFSEYSLKQLLLSAGFKRVQLFPHEKKVIRSFTSRRQRFSWQLREWFIRWLLSEFHLHLMEGSYPQIQTVNILCVAEK